MGAVYKPGAEAMGSCRAVIKARSVSDGIGVSLD